MRKSIIKFTGLAAVLAVAGACAVQANHGPGHHRGDRAERMFERMDIDKDGIATLADAKALAATRFAAMDTDGDGVISRPERREFRQGRRADRKAARFARLDGDGNGLVSMEEMKAAADTRVERRFARLDQNADGMVSMDEMEAATGKRAEGRGKGKRGEGKRRAGRGPMTLDKMESRAAKRFNRIDADGDGQITLADVQAAGPLRKQR